MNWPTVRSLGTRYFFLSIEGTVDDDFDTDFSQITGILSLYLDRMRVASVDLVSKVWSVLNCEGMVA